MSAKGTKENVSCFSLVIYYIFHYSIRLTFAQRRVNTSSEHSHSVHNNYVVGPIKKKELQTKLMKCKVKLLNLKRLYIKIKIATSRSLYIIAIVLYNDERQRIAYHRNYHG